MYFMSTSGTNTPVNYTYDPEGCATKAKCHGCPLRQPLKPLDPGTYAFNANDNHRTWLLEDSQFPNYPGTFWLLPAP